MIDKTIAISGFDRTIHDEKTQTTVYVAGYFQNLDEIGRTLGLARTQDSQLNVDAVIISACHKWRETASRYLLGEFAIVFIDRVKGEAILVHDEFGLRPLYYSLNRMDLSVFLSPRHISLKMAPDDVETAYVSEVLFFGDSKTRMTVKKGRFRLLPGESATWREGKLDLHTCWSEFGYDQPRYIKPYEWAEHLRELIEVAVKSTVPSIGKTWCELSGGLDSSTVMAAALKSGFDHVEAISFLYSSSTEADERHWVDEFIKMYPVPLTVLDADEFKPFTGTPTFTMPDPTGGLSISALDNAYAAILRSNQVGCVLTGMGGDDVFWGYQVPPVFAADLLRKCKFNELSGAIARWAKCAKPRRSSSHWLWVGAVGPLLEKVHPTSPTAPSWVTPKARLQALRSRWAREQNVPECTSLAARSYVSRVIGTALTVSTRSLPSDVNTELRNPLFYRPLVNFLSSIPYEFQADGVDTRRLQRLAMQGDLPNDICERRSKPDLDGVAFRGLATSTSWFGFNGKKGVLEDLGLLDGEKWRAAVDNARLGCLESLRSFTAAADMQLWMSINTGPEERKN